MSAPNWRNRYALVVGITSDRRLRLHAMPTERSRWKRTPCGLGADALVFVDVANLRPDAPRCARCFPPKPTPEQELDALLGGRP